MKRIFSIVWLLTVMCNIQAQDFTFSQFYETPLLRNPALAGIFNGNIRFQSAFRSQWSSVTVPYQTQSLSGEVTFPLFNSDDLITAGVQVTNDQAGDSKLGRLQLLPVVSFHKAFNDETSFLTIAFMGGLVQSKFDPTRLKFNDQFQNGSFDATNPTAAVFDQTNLTYADASTGLAFNGSLGDEHRFYVGAACYHFLRSKVSFYNSDDIYLKRRFVFNGGVNLNTGDLDHTYIYGDFITQGGNRQFLAGVLYKHILQSYVSYDKFSDDISLVAGAAYRWGDAIMPIVKLEMKSFSFGASYDINISKLSRASQFRGGLEVTASYLSTIKSILPREYKGEIGCPVTRF